MAEPPKYLITLEAAELLRVAPKTLRNKVARGIFRAGEHFFRRPGLGPRWKREALVGWLEHRELEVEGATAVEVPLAESKRLARWA